MTIVEIISLILFGAFMFFVLTILENSLTNYLDARAGEIKLANRRIEDITEKEAFERIAYRYPARPEELEMILDKYYSGGFVEVEFYGRLIGELVPREEITEEQAWEVLGEKYGLSRLKLKEDVDKLIDFLEQGYTLDKIENNEATQKEVQIFMDTIVKEGTFKIKDQEYSVIEIPTIPQLVADWIESRKNIGWGLSLSLDESFMPNPDEWSGREWFEDWIELKRWRRETIGSDELIARAWLDGYEIEQEPKYYAKVIGWDVFEKGYRKPYWCLLDKIPSKEKTISISVHGTKEILTKKEWEKYGINEGNAEFELVEELE